MNKILTSCGFIIATLGVIAAFMTATTYIQLAIAIVLYPMLVFFALKTFPRKNSKYQAVEPAAAEPIIAAVQPPLPEAENTIPDNRQADPTKLENISIADIDKRLFLKLIGGAGLALFLFSIFNKKGESLFFKSAPQTTGTVSLQDIAGNKIDPAQSQPMDGYRISEIDDNVITFYGFTNKNGAWYIMKEDTDTGSFRYAKGDSKFPDSWTNRENLKYDYFSNLF